MLYILKNSNLVKLNKLNYALKLKIIYSNNSKFKWSEFKQVSTKHQKSIKTCLKLVLYTYLNLIFFSKCLFNISFYVCRVVTRFFKTLSRCS